ncbi:hypothetical protein KFE25_006309 [Diacronema lutheri]|uniref:Uncharacterized protein n=1 Tax=Diacronema lutheri TaxID=2081491 RepID=A0A8J6CEN6_DIALT|nr:hypothetical protein KFE25_006309 [Diacronema lutheri]
MARCGRRRQFGLAGSYKQATDDETEHLEGAAAKRNMATPRTPLSAVLPPRYHGMFRHATLNAVQSAVATDVLRSDVNLVVASPTASGKTGVFELALVRMIETVPNGKALFLAPMKSICSERCADWTARFAPHGLDVMLLTGDTDSADDQGAWSPLKVVEGLSKARVIVATTEKWDVWTRTHRNADSVIGQVALLCVDEVHMLGERRGPTIEAVVSRMRMISRIPELVAMPIARLRVLALSATMANPRTLCAWLGEEQTVIHNFDSSFRPTPLSVTVTGFRSSIPARFDQDTLLPALPGTIRDHSSGRPTLVFFSTRKLSIDGALKLASSGVPNRSVEAAAAAATATFRGSAQLAQLLRSGVAYHVASMSAEERRVIENLFADGHLSVLCATGGLSLGVNLPAHLVVICGTTRWYGATEGFVDYSNSDILQMAGRAGRPQYDTEGKCVVLTTEASAAKYTDLLNGVQPICSHMHEHLCEHLNAEINTASYMISAEVALGFVKSTFLYKCVLDASLRHNFRLPRDATQQQLDAEVSRLCLLELGKLHAAGLIRLGNAGATIEPLPAGRIMAHYSVRFQSMALITAQLTPHMSVEQLLGLLSRCAELQDSLRRSERKPLYELNKGVRYPCLDAKLQVAKVGDSVLKTNVLLQVACGGEVRDGELLAAMGRAAKEGQRLLVCIGELARERGHFETLLHAHTLARCLARGAGWGDAPSKLLTQLPGIGDVLADRLVAVGITSIKGVARARASQLECSCFKSAPFGAELANKARRIPELSVWVRRDNDVTVAAPNADAAGRLSVGATCVRPPSVFDARSADAKFTLLVGDAVGSSLFLCKPFKLHELEQSVSFCLPPRAVSAPGGALRICLLHEHYVGIDVEARVRMPLDARGGEPIELALQPIAAPPCPPPPPTPQRKPAAKPRAQPHAPEQVAQHAQREQPPPPPPLTPRKRERGADGGASTLSAQRRMSSVAANGARPPVGDASAVAGRALRPATAPEQFATPGGAAPRSDPRARKRGVLHDAPGPSPASRAPCDASNDALDAFFDQFKHADEVDTPPSKAQRASRLEPPRDLRDAPRLLGGLAQRASFGGSSASDLIAQLRSTIRARALLPPNAPLSALPLNVAPPHVAPPHVAPPHVAPPHAAPSHAAPPHVTPLSAAAHEHVCDNLPACGQVDAVAACARGALDAPRALDKVKMPASAVAPDVELRARADGVRPNWPSGAKVVRRGAFWSRM